MQKFDLSIVSCEIGSVLIFTKNGICEKIELSNDFYAPSGENIFTAQISEYLSGKRRELDFPVRYSSGPVFEKIWESLKENVPYGKIITYGELAKICNVNPRVVGYAMAMNRLPLYIPCHRVVGKNSLGGFNGKNGLKWKEYLLRLEGSI
ncbi:MAG: methylated-DNA--[protein]-cysteine S-methyltransferase [Fervidobacterium sp.]|uniref:methylated-DNA--[protein]-cysteine S-methyltransferase n=1 Tax=Fervidobacterium sp. TaxID=1871331 RepID=UPI00404A3237